MPIFECKCARCGERFEHLKKADGDNPVCPSCSSRDVKLLLSTFAVTAGAGAGARTRTQVDERCAGCTGDPATCPRYGSMP